MSGIAYNIHGEPFEVPAKVTAFRVRRLKARGAPEVLYGFDGVPLVVPVDFDLDELRTLIADLESDEPVRLRLDPIDDRGRVVDEVPAAYVQLAPRRVALSASPAPVGGVGEVSVVLEAMRMNAEMARMALQQLPAIMAASAKVLAAADGAGLPARPPLALALAADNDEADQAQAKAETRPRNATAEVIESVSGLAQSLRPYAKLAATMLGGKNGARNAAALDDADDRKSMSPPRDAPASATPAPIATSPSDPNASAAKDQAALMAHVAAVQAQLTTDERTIVQTAAAEMSPAEIDHWIATLGRLSVEQAVTEVRRMIGSTTGGAS